MYQIIKTVSRLSAVITILLISQYTGAQSSFKKLVWSDEFNGKGLPDSSKWSYDKGRGCPENWNIIPGTGLKTLGWKKDTW